MKRPSASWQFVVESNTPLPRETRTFAAFSSAFDKEMVAQPLGGLSGALCLPGLSGALPEEVSI